MIRGTNKRCTGKKFFGNLPRSSCQNLFLLQTCRYKNLHIGVWAPIFSLKLTAQNARTCGLLRCTIIKEMLKNKNIYKRYCVMLVVYSNNHTIYVSTRLSGAKIYSHLLFNIIIVQEYIGVIFVYRILK